MFSEQLRGVVQAPKESKLVVWDGMAWVSLEDLYGATQHYIKEGGKSLPFNNVFYTLEKVDATLNITHQPSHS